MPQTTGRGKPTGRPRGSGRRGLGIDDPQARVTVRLPPGLYAKLQAYAQGRAFRRGTPELALCIREALEHFFACPHRAK
jgi:hypothetical protein